MLETAATPLGQLLDKIPGGFNISSWPTLSILSAVACFTMIYGIYHVIWSLWFHPLSYYPGPRLAAISDLWLVSSYLRGTTPTDLERVHKKYGDVVRISPNTLSTIDPETWKLVYGHKSAGQAEFTKHPHTYLGFPAGSIINVDDPSEHAHLRKLFAPGFSDKSLRDQEPVLVQYLDLFCQRIREVGKDGTKALNMLDWYNFITFDFIGFLTFGESFGCLETSTLHPWIKLVFSQARFVTYYQALSRLPFFIRIPALLWVMPSSVNADTADLHRLHGAKVQHRLSTPPENPDFMTKLIASYSSGTITAGQLDANANVLVTAGSETSATALAGLTHYLLRDPRRTSFNRLRDEVRSAFETKEEITIASVNARCRYLVACVDESLRLYAPLPNPLYRIVPPAAEGGGPGAGGFKLPGGGDEDRYVPPGTAIGVAPYATARSKRNWHRGSEFLPERWLMTSGNNNNNNNEEFKRDKREASQPFSYGPRNCIGQTLAVMEMRMIVARLVWEFDFEDGGGDEENDKKQQQQQQDWLDKKTFLVWDKRPLWVRWRPVVRG